MPAPVAPGQPTRRVVVRAAAGVAGAVLTSALTGCRLRLEDDAPAVPLIPRKSIDDEALLVETYRQVRELAAMAALVPGSDLARLLAAQHERQATVLRAVLAGGGVPTSVIEPPATSSASGPGSGTAAPSTSTVTSTPASVTPGALAASEARAVADPALGQLAAAVAHRPLLTAVTAHRAAAATLLGVPPVWPAGTPLPADAAPAALEPTREAVYATEVATARVPSADRAPFLALLTVLQRRAVRLRLAAGGVDDSALAYRLPFPVRTAPDARRLVSVALDGLVARGLDPLAVLPAGAPAVTEVARLQAEAAAVRHEWGGALPPFPGLVDG